MLTFWLVMGGIVWYWLVFDFAVLCWMLMVLENVGCFLLVGVECCELVGVFFLVFSVCLCLFVLVCYGLCYLVLNGDGPSG